MTSLSSPGKPTILGKDIPVNSLPDSSLRYLLLITELLEYWAYRPIPQTGELLPAYAPGVLDLVHEFAASPHYAWTWKRGPLDEYYERGPLLVDATHQPALMEHALTVWAPIGGVLVIGSDADLNTLSTHLGSLVQIALPDQSMATSDIRPQHLAAWLEALDEDHREAWLGPMTTLLWRNNWGPVHDWFRLDRHATSATGEADEGLSLREHELVRFEANTREHFLLSRVHEVRAMPDYATRTLEEVRRWVEQILNVAGQLNIHDDADAQRLIELLAHDPWLLHSDSARTLLNELTESPPARLRKLALLAQAKESPHD
ncbi:DUF4123 domain-containing protein [Pseudomonas sp. R5(2019)]|uniref:DUF4123 domain-containing protein n=1 Tax=Pseudomonas sp. R5(2019) TaxID=2697566 RepID=UPI00141342C2|nr:DUF4123 domain-containing protein [Pseudomonas sp. R5(2019)]NBA94144.1 DUF4123 domain-containing protein [Pseudomonas sp. R5(2019)]